MDEVGRRMNRSADAAGRCLNVPSLPLLTPKMEPMPTVIKTFPINQMSWPIWLRLWPRGGRSRLKT